MATELETTLHAENQKLLEDRQQLNQQVENLGKQLEYLDKKDLFKWYVLILGGACGLTSLGLAIASCVDNNNAQNRASVAVSSLAVAISAIGVFAKCCPDKQVTPIQSKKQQTNSNEDVSENKPWSSVTSNNPV